MDNTNAGSNVCELAAFFRDVHELQVSVREVRDEVSNLRLVVQGEQDRLTETEELARADRSLMADMGERLVNLKRQVEQSLFASHSACKDVKAVSEHMHEARGRLSDHGGQLASALASIEDLRGALKSSNDHLADVSGRATDAHARLDGVHQNLQLHAEELGNGSNNAACLEVRLSAAEEQNQCLATAHGETAGTLRNLISSTIKQVLDRAEEDRAWLHAVDARAIALEEHRTRSDDHASQLAAAGRMAAADLQALQERVTELTASTRRLHDQLGQTRVELKADRELSDDAWRSIRALQEKSQTFNAALNQTHDDVTDVLRDSRQRAEQLHCLAEDLAALGHGLEITDGDVCSLQALLEGVPSGAQQYSS